MSDFFNTVAQVSSALSTYAKAYERNVTIIEANLEAIWLDSVERMTVATEHLVATLENTDRDLVDIELDKLKRELDID